VRLGRRIKALRREQSLSQESLAERALLDAKHLAVMERGATNPTLASIAWVARGLGVSLARLFEGI
jgi:transcriptional regulator with XRE-family HTH domain